MPHCSAGTRALQADETSRAPDIIPYKRETKAKHNRKQVDAIFPSGIEGTNPASHTYLVA